MTTPSEEMLAQRQLRAAEVALDSARRQRRETAETLELAQRRIDDAEAALAESLVVRQRDAYDFRVQMATARENELASAMKFIQERNHRLSLEQEVAALKRQKIKRDDLSRQLAAEARIRALEGELELVIRHAAEFEYRVRMAAFDAFKLVRDLSDVVSGLLQRARILDPPRSSRPARDGLPEGESEDSRDPTGYVPAPSVESVLDSQRLDAALQRLRATTPPPEDDE